MNIRTIKAKKEDIKEIVESIGLRKRSDDKDYSDDMKKIIDDVREKGDAAVCEYTEKFDKVIVKPQGLRVGKEEIETAYKNVDDKLIKILEKAKENILDFHIAQKCKDVFVKRGESSYIRLVSKPLENVGIYVPGGTAPLPSSVLMNAMPAKAAGVKKIIMCTPPLKNGGVDPVILAAAKIAGVDEIYRIGGAQAIAAMAYGTENVPCVDKICGPGNIYVNTAKRLVYGRVDVDMFAGPSEILVIADKHANPAFVSADLLSQAEHDVLASAVLVTDDEKFAGDVAKDLALRSGMMPRSEIIKESVENYCAVVIVPDLDTAVDFSNEIAPEHLEICTQNPESILEKIRNAGAVFLGNYSPEPLGDYYAGANHVLPTSGTARFFSPLNTADFMKKMSVINYSGEDFKKCYKEVSEFAKAEQLECHSQASLVRFGEDAVSKKKSKA